MKHFCETYLLLANQKANNFILYMIDEEKHVLIYLYKGNPILWDNVYPDYRNKINVLDLCFHEKLKLTFYHSYELFKWLPTPP